MKISPTEFVDGMIPFYFFESKGRAFVYSGMYADRGDACRAALDTNKITGKLTCMMSRPLPRLKFLSGPRIMLLRNVSGMQAFGA